MSSKERLETEFTEARSDSRLVAVTIDAIHLDKELIYSVPEELADSIALGTPVIVSVIGRKRRGWVTSLEPESELDAAKIRPLGSLDDYSLSREIFALCEWAALRYGSSQVYFLKHARSASHALPVSLGYQSSYLRPGHSVSYLRISPCDDLDSVVAEVVAATSRRGLRTLVVFSNEIEARRLKEFLGEAKIASYLLERSLPKYKRFAPLDASAIVSTRLGVFAPIAQLGAIVVVDPDDKGHKNVSEPTWQSVVIAAERARLEEVPLIIISGYPAPEHTHLAQVRKPSSEIGCWPKVEVVHLEGAISSLVTPELTQWMQSFLASRGVGMQNPLVLLLNRKGRVNRFRCRKCGAALRCEACNSLLVMGEPYLEPGREAAPEALHHYHFRTDRARQAYERLFPRGLVCPGCGLRTPPACGNCKSTSISPVTVGTTRIADEIFATLGVHADLIDESTSADALRTSPIVVATEAALTRVVRASALAFVDFDQYQFSSSFAAVNRLFRAWYKSAVLLVKGNHPALDVARARLLVQTREPDSELLGAISAAKPAAMLAIDRNTRRKLGLPPYSALALVKGKGVKAFAAHALLIVDQDASGEFADVEVVVLSDEKMVIKAPNSDVLARYLLGLKGLRSEVVIHVDPDEI